MLINIIILCYSIYIYVYSVIVFWYGFLKGILNLGFLVCDFWLGVVDFFIFVYILNKFIVYYLYVLFFIKFCYEKIGSIICLYNVLFFFLYIVDKLFIYIFVFENI